MELGLQASKMPRGLRASKSGLEKAKKEFKSKGWTQDYLAGAVGCSRQTAYKFFTRQPVDKRFFQGICCTLGLELGDIAELESEGEDGNPQGDKENTERNAKLVITLSGDIETILNKPDVQQALLVLIQKLSADASLNIEKIEKGSIKITLTGSPEGLKRLDELIKSGDLREVLGMPIEGVQLLTDNAIEEDISSNVPNSKLIESEAVTISENRQRGLYIPNTRCRRVWGRDELVKKVLCRLSDPQELSILALSGIAGYGKTEVATQVAKTALKNNIFADVLWVTARQTELVDGRISEENQYEVLNWNRFLHEIADQLRCPVEGIRQRLKEEKLLVVLDNAETADLESILSQLNRIVNPSRVLLTSRVKTKPPYVGLIPIEGLDLDWSSKLLNDEAEYNNIPVLLQASDVQIERVHELSRGAPLALHFVVSSVLNYNALEPVLAGLEKAQGQVEQFYKFTLETAWQRINNISQDVLRYMGRNDAGVTQAELSRVRELSDSQLDIALSELRRWYLVEDKTDNKNNLRYDLHPWIRSSVRNGLVDSWQPSLEDLEQIAKSKFGLDISNL